MDFALSDEERAVRETARDFVRKEVVPLEADDRRTAPESVSRGGVSTRSIPGPGVPGRVVPAGFLARSVRTRRPRG